VEENPGFEACPLLFTTKGAWVDPKIHDYDETRLTRGRGTGVVSGNLQCCSHPLLCQGLQSKQNLQNLTYRYVRCRKDIGGMLNFPVSSGCHEM
jgi:hypothetical protein